MKFEGFHSRSGRNTSVPDQFFADLLNQIDHLGELKVTLVAFRQLNRKEGSIRFLTREDWLGDPEFMKNFGREEEQEAGLDEALARAVARGTFLQVKMENGERIFLLNSPKGRAAVEGLQAGRWSPEELKAGADSTRLEAPNIYNLYEAHIGPLTPLLAEGLRDAEEEYPGEWIRDAIRIAVENNVRKWRYVEAILKSWQEKGRDDGRNSQNTEKDRRKYVGGEFAEYIEY